MKILVIVGLTLALTIIAVMADGGGS